ncbi:MAG TPA: efflux transporter outer membrane subunit [Cellvibrionaceae bacterium]|nr:efflux transporter outer membrane subunit [Cellvibrionaceae bacterium]
MPRNLRSNCLLTAWLFSLLMLCACSQQAAKATAPALGALASAPAPALSSQAQAIAASQVPFTASGSEPSRLANWQAFGSPGLERMLAEAAAHSPEGAAARARLEQAQARYGLSRASLWPQLGLSVSSGKSRSKLPQGEVIQQGNSRASLSLEQDLDLFGAERASRRSASYSLKASTLRAGADQLELNLAIAQAWFTHLALNERYSTQSQNLAIAQQILQLVEARFKAGAVSAADLSQQRTNLLAQQAALLPIEAQRQANLAALAVLVGAAPQTFNPPAEALSQLRVPALAAQWPAQVLTQRPDIGILEAQLAAADADISQARAAFFPRLSLGAAASLTSGELFSLNPATQGLSWSLNLAQSLFDGGAKRNQYRLAKAQRLELVETYRKAVLNALAQSQTALANAGINQQQEEQQRQLVEEAQRSLALTQARYKAGRGDLQNLLDAQRSLFSAQDGLQQKCQARLLGALDLVQALGGWPQGS